MVARKLRILLADDHETLREGLKMIINGQSDMEVVGEAGEGGETVDKAKEVLPDVVVMDVSMPQVNGLKATEMLRQACPGARVLALTRHSEQGYLQQMLGAGASAYVLKQSRPAELLYAIRAVGVGASYVDPAVAGKVMVGHARRSPAANGAPEALSTREAEVLRLIAWGYSNKEIAARLSLSVKTIETHKANAMRKLDMRRRIDIVRFALLQGWLEDT
jgi:DNA-binding NarL/FixJ family response regulator